MYVLDTNTLIYYFKGQGQVAQNLANTPPQEIIISTRHCPYPNFDELTALHCSIDIAFIVSLLEIFTLIVELLTFD